MPDGDQTLFDYLKKYAPAFLAQLTDDAKGKLKLTSARIGTNPLMQLRNIGAATNPLHIPGVGAQVVVDPKYVDDPTYWQHEAINLLVPQRAPHEQMAAWSFVPEERKQEMSAWYTKGAKNPFQEALLRSGFGVHAGREFSAVGLQLAGWDPSKLPEYERGFLGNIYLPEVLEPPTEPQPERIIEGGISKIALPPVTTPTPTPRRRRKTPSQLFRPTPSPVAPTPPRRRFRRRRAR